MPTGPYTEPELTGPEVPLGGGDVTAGVVRIGHTVRRPLGPNSSLVHALLDYLESIGFGGAPRLLGIDASGREVLTFIEGEIAGRPRPTWLADEDRLVSVGRLVRSYDDAAVGFVAPDQLSTVSGQKLDPAPELPPTPPYPPELIGHMDFTPDNIVFRQGRAFALIDFDLATSATRLDEVYNAMIHWVPLQDPCDADQPLKDVDPFRRARLLADAYGMDSVQRSRLLEVAIMRTRRSWFSMKHAAQVRGGGWARMWAEGVGDRIKRREAWLEHNGAKLEAALKC